MPTTFTITRLRDLRVGDVILSLDGRPYRKPRVVTTELGPIEPGSPVVGVRLENPNPSSEIEYVLYPSQVDGLQMEVQRG
ncbi:hypothetical protein [Propionibacterium freudenreichii]|uniref:hypothetical protein n=1 Tax=Propionibacterium freudenreichii TaxID=1744 RepID=UPI0011086967|nr:hypothetical protein [Propionibacterium freudenreichii]MDK9322188.1 hypothetical protein [Propionibacterium freudenreichii]MDK9351916.1 hypothetical protein [Propionibacterium freudenreichii]MDK9676620.1 hypothetical protein [Propionibacterium freudenreichii]